MGRLIYVSYTRLDITYAVSVVESIYAWSSEFAINVSYFKILKWATGKGILFLNRGQLELEDYTNADWAGLVDRGFSSGYCTFVGGNLVTWKSEKQTVVARSSAEAECKSMVHGISELMWLKILMEDLRLLSNGPMRLYYDNEAATDIAHNSVKHDRI